MNMAQLQLLEQGSPMWSAQRRVKARAAKRRPAFFCRIELLPLLGMLFTLLIIFMVNVPLPHHGNFVDLVKTRHSVYQLRAIREDAVYVFITRDGTAYFGNTRINPIELPDQIRARVREGAERKVYLTVDARARFGRVATVVDGVRLAGLQDISFITE
jgi:biopolymer transport protein ExbD